MNQLYELVNGKVVLFINAIRGDHLSGGNSSTLQILEQLKKNSSTYEFNLSNNQKGVLQIINTITGLPGAVFVILNRSTKFVVFEFLTKLSLLSYVQLFVKCHTLKPDIIVFNHHASFIYSFGFSKIDKIFIWHDVPSIKNYGKAKFFSRVASRVSLIFEKFIVDKSLKHFAFSFSDRKFFKRLHGAELGLLPIVFEKFDRNIHLYDKNTWLLVGNWSRYENQDGAIQFFNIIFSRIKKNHDWSTIKFIIAGNAADKFLEKIVKDNKTDRIKIIAEPHYKSLSDFKVNGLLAPITQGAGIKVKVIESWASGLSVIGTQQAFSGIPHNIKKKGGICVSNTLEMVNLVMGNSAMDIESLRPQLAYCHYLSEIDKSRNLMLTN